MGDIPIQEQTRILLAAQERIRDYVHPAYRLFIDYFSELEAKAGIDDGSFYRLLGRLGTLL